jgi:hydroxypyruvate reductase
MAEFSISKGGARGTGGANLSSDRQAVIHRIVQAALSAADPARAVEQALVRQGDELVLGEKRFPISTGRLRVVGTGKAAEAMARGLYAVVGDKITDGVLIAKHVSTQPAGLPAGLRVLAGSHPVPGEPSVRSTQQLVEYLQAGRSDDLVICLISGGGSALMTWPQESVSLADLQVLTQLLLASGANITEINTLRKHLDRVKGGGLARLAAPAQVVTLILSDVIGSPLDVIASGPTVADPSTFAQAYAILEKYQLIEKTPSSIRTVLQQGMAGQLPETLKTQDAALQNVTNRVVASNPQAAQYALQQAEREGFHTLLLTTYLQGEASQAGAVMAGVLKQIDASGQPLARPACLVAGGETTVTLRGSGLGGRNQEMALGAAFLLEGVADVAFLTLGTDGEDGPTDAAGALVTGESLAGARQAGLNPLAYLQNNDSYHFFEATGDLLITGPTGTNVNDLAFLFAF